MGEPALQLVETTEVENKALSIVDQAKAVKIVDAGSYTVAGALWKSIKDMMKEVADTFDPIIEKAHASHKEALAQKAKFYAPLEAAYRSVKGLMSTYDAEQERIRLAEQRRLEEIARKVEEERLLREAIAAEEEARRNGATKEEAAQEAEAVIDAPVYVAPVILPKTTPKLAGGPVFQNRWDFEITDAGKIPREYMTPDLVKIRQIVTALKDSANIPGIRAYSKRV